MRALRGIGQRYLDRLDRVKKVSRSGLLPVLSPNKNVLPAGLESVTPHKFRNGHLSDQQHAALAKMKQYTDFNDLATKSTLGRDAVERRVRPVIDSMMGRRQPPTRQDQDRERVQRQKIKQQHVAKIS